MIKGDHGPTKLLHALTWGTFNHASHAPLVRACNYYMSVCLCECTCIHMHVHCMCTFIVKLTSSP